MKRIGVKGAMVKLYLHQHWQGVYGSNVWLLMGVRKNRRVKQYVHGVHIPVLLEIGQN